MRLGVFELGIIGLTALLIFGTKRLRKIKKSFNKAGEEYKNSLEKKE